MPRSLRLRTGRLQESLFANTDLSVEDSGRILLEENLPRFRIIGQLFETYWLIQYEDKLLVIDQHAAHEKVNFERLMKRLENSGSSGRGSQMLAPASVITLTGREEGEYLAHRDVFASMVGMQDFKFAPSTEMTRAGSSRKRWRR